MIHSRAKPTCNGGAMTNNTFSYAVVALASAVSANCFLSFRGLAPPYLSLDSLVVATLLILLPAACVYDKNWPAFGIVLSFYVAFIGWSIANLSSNLSRHDYKGILVVSWVFLYATMLVGGVWWAVIVLRMLTRRT
jgi:hypothetical protein